MKITYAKGARHPSVEAILNAIAPFNQGATATVKIPEVIANSPDPKRRQVVFSAPSLDLAQAIPLGLDAASIALRGLESKRSGANTVVTITYKLG
jgi:hypothetical protein